MIGYREGSLVWRWMIWDIGGEDMYESMSYLSCIGGVVEVEG